MNILNLNKKIILITGASGGIGLAISKCIAELNGIPILHYNKNESNIIECMTELKALGKECYCIRFNICNEQEVKEGIKEIKRKHGRLDGLVNNAGILARSFIATHSLKTFNEVMDINVTGSFSVLKYVSQLMINQKSGNIVNVSSLAATMGLMGQAAYSISKAGVNALTMIAAKEFAQYNIRVNGVAPGYIKTGMLSNPTAHDNSYINQIPLQRFGYDYEVAKVVAFLLSDGSSYITGQSIIIDGGLSISK